MAGTIAVTSLEDVTGGLRGHVVETPPPTSVEVGAKLQQIARDRLDPTNETDVAARSHRGSRSLRQRRQPLVGAFDSPEGFVFGSSGANRKR